MRRTRLLQIASAALLLGTATGCFVNDEINKAASLNKGPADAVAKKDSKSGAKEATGDAAAAPADGKPASPSGPGWWQTARSITSEEPSNSNISRCQLSHGVEFMQREDCLARGGTPK